MQFTQSLVSQSVTPSTSVTLLARKWGCSLGVNNISIDIRDCMIIVLGPSLGNVDASERPEAEVELKHKRFNLFRK